jgi:hypothetical protein
MVLIWLFNAHLVCTGLTVIQGLLATAVVAIRSVQLNTPKRTVLQA